MEKKSGVNHQQSSPLSYPPLPPLLLAPESIRTMNPNHTEARVGKKVCVGGGGGGGGPHTETEEQRS